MTVADLQLDLEVFTGPFDLLLTLVLREEVDLMEVELAEVVLTYVDFLEARGELDLEAATEFLVLIAALLELKSRLMLPREDEDLLDLEPGEAAEERLERALGEHALRLAEVEQDIRVHAEPAERGEDALDLHEGKEPRAGVRAETCEIHRQGPRPPDAVPRLARPEHPRERVARPEPEEAEPGERDAAPLRLPRDGGHDDGERPVAPGGEDRRVPAVEERPGDAVALLDPTGHVDVPAREDLVEGPEDVRRDAAGVAVDDHRDARLGRSLGGAHEDVGVLHRSAQRIWTNAADLR